MEKVVGGSSEAIWKLIYKGVVTSTKDGYSLAEDETTLNEKIGEYIHGLRRWLNLDGKEAQVVGGENIDSSNWAMMIVRLIEATSDIAWQILIGAERGDVVNKQDQATWAGHIKTTRMKYANPLIRNPIDQFVRAGAVPAPQSEDYVIERESLFEMTKEEEADLASIRASALGTATGVVVTGLITDEEVRGFGGSPPEPPASPASASSAPSKTSSANPKTTTDASTSNFWRASSCRPIRRTIQLAQQTPAATHGQVQARWRV